MKQRRPLLFRAATRNYERPSSSEIQQTQQRLIYESPAPYVSSTHWCILDKKKNELLFGKQEAQSRQVASLTKIMTSLVVLDMVEDGVCPLKA